MKKIKVFLLMSIIAGSGSIWSQQALFGGPGTKSPEIHEDNTVTFRIKAPGANEVKLYGDWIPWQGWVPGSIELSRGEDDTWSVTTDPLQPDLYSYSFEVDGVRTIDLENVHVIRDVATLSNIFIIEGGNADLYKVNNVPHGSVTKRWYNSPGNDMQRRVSIYTPPGYEDSDEEYPVLYLLHGMGGDEEAWLALGRTAQIMDNLIAQGKAKPMIVVMPNGNVVQQAAPGESPKGLYKPIFQLPHTMDGKMEETFPDILHFAESAYRIKAGKENRAIAGLSMGGFHSLHISRYYPGTFDYVGLFSPAILPDEKSDSRVYKDIEGTLRTQMEKGIGLYWIGIGKTDFLMQYVVDYRKKLDEMGMEYSYTETEGGHTWSNWRNYLASFVPLLF